MMVVDLGCMLIAQHIAFIYDPDGYWVEIIAHGGKPLV
jgi:hypothetical protein